MVETTLPTLQLLVSKPLALFDPYATLAALEQLADRAKRHPVILHQLRPMVNDSFKLVAIRRQYGAGNPGGRPAGRAGLVLQPDLSGSGCHVV